jgi:hypothetical protein
MTMSRRTYKKVLAEERCYKIIVESVKSQLTLNGMDDLYAIVNKETGVVEGRGATLPDALSFMHSVQAGYDNVLRQAAQIESTQGLSAEHPSN